MKRIMTALVVTGLLVVPLAAHASASAVGWWTRNPAATAPDDGGQVANGPDGVISYAAVRTAIDGNTIDTAKLSFREVDGSINGSSAAIEACPAIGSWEAGKGTHFDGPKADCGLGRVSLTRDAAGGWSADVASVLQGSGPAVAIVPSDGAGVFQVTFGPPKLEVTTKAPSSSSSGGAGSSSFDSSEFTSGSSTSHSGSFPSSGSTGGSSSTSGADPSSRFDPSATFAPVATAGTVPDGSGPEDGAGISGESAAPELADGARAPSGQVRAIAAAAPGTAGNKLLQYIFFVTLAGLIGTGAGLARNQLAKRAA